MFSKIVLLSALASSAFATVFITSPTATSTFNGGQTATISWIDSNGSPSLQDWGSAKVSIYTGNANQQTLLQQVTASVNVATTSSIQFTPDPKIGPNGQEYFIRVESLTLKDANNTQYPEMSFSALFTMASMTGTFNSSVQAQIDGQSTAPIGGSTTGSIASSTGSSAASSTKAASTTGSSTATSKGASSTTASAASSAKSNGAVGLGSVANVWVSAVLGGAVMVSLML
ncbi:hypothetical protein GYMLUDRAFT_96667 [Collybiopsis luxurians FD-317 M1]|uniref:Yeast cell wall synthesis Kre9/Knh1-like N-terminal domain-containing protein n=1 Tax=Collybiopsis luxurians FD-317 M1 TaxID=944289 RepID=A0A0D0BC58_9AGAR|nr:hypothetical protein GYMLUDRAFT_96667 [Collybiopsis luxurians FD-317 M1]